MKKINFMAFFTIKEKKHVDQGILLANKIIIPLYLLIIISMHSLQLYKWYQFSLEKKSYKNQSHSIESITKDHNQIRNDKLIVQEKITFLDQQKKESSAFSQQLKTMYDNSQKILTHLTIKNNHFSCSCTQKSPHNAHEFLKKLKSQTLIKKTRITHLIKKNDCYTVDIKGSFIDIKKEPHQYVMP